MAVAVYLCASPPCAPLAGPWQRTRSPSTWRGHHQDPYAPSQLTSSTRPSRQIPLQGQAHLPLLPPQQRPGGHHRRHGGRHYLQGLPHHRLLRPLPSATNSTHLCIGLEILCQGIMSSDHVRWSLLTLDKKCKYHTLENQASNIKEDAESQRIQCEDLEVELQNVRHQMTSVPSSGCNYLTGRWNGRVNCLNSGFEAFGSKSRFRTQPNKC